MGAADETRGIRMDDVKEYLIKKIRRTHVEHPRANKGAKLIKLYPTYEEDMDIMLLIVIGIINWFFKKDTSDSPAGTCKETNTSITIGQSLFRYMKREPVHYLHNLDLGDLFIDALYNCGYIDLQHLVKQDKSIEMKPAKKWSQIGEYISNSGNKSLRNTHISKPEYELPKLKNHLTNSTLYRDSPFVRSINKLQQTPWRINTPVFEALQEVDGFVSHVEEEDELKELKRRSKCTEWDFIKTKAIELIDKDFYQEMSVDYRGRTYYDEPFLNYQGPDLIRGMMLFSEGKPM